MKLKQNRKRTRAAFTLIEMIGVLAVIAILAALLIPKVFAAINSAKISNTSTSINTVKTAAIDHYAKFGTLTVDGSNTSAPPVPIVPGAGSALQYDKVLLSEGFLDKLFQVKIGDGIIGAANTRIQLVAPLADTDTPDGTGAGYDLDGDSVSGTNGNDATGSYVLEAVIMGVALADARDLNRIMDGTDTALGEEAGGEDISGRVTYEAPDATTGLVDVFVYLTHR